VFSIVIATPDVVGERMAGPGIRAWHFADELAKHFPTTLVANLEGDVSTAPFPIVARDSHEAREAMRGASVLIGQPARRFRRRRREQRIVYDLFDPILLELNETYGRHPSLRQRIHVGAERWRLRTALSQGDLLICATARQRDLYNGVGDRMIEIPFGVDMSVGAPALGRPAAGAAAATPTILWGGGTWEWLDPRTAIDAVAQLNREGLSCRLLFLGRHRPNRQIVDRRREDRFDQLLESGKPYVEANDEWVAYRDRLAWLRRSKIAIMLHRPTAEAVYSIRTRLFDAIAAGVPVITTEEGFAADLVRREGVGLVVPPLDRSAVAAAIRRLLQDDVFYGECVSSLARVRPRFAWDVVMRPLIEVIRQWQKQS
jgi:glycosyltransferase involved in cell wall biosynthesis